MKTEAITETIPFPTAPARDVLHHVLRDGARRMLAQAIEQEVEEHLAPRSHLTDEAGHRQVVRHGFLPRVRSSRGWAPSLLLPDVVAGKLYTDGLAQKTAA